MGYKYFNLDVTYGYQGGLEFFVGIVPEGVDAVIDIMVDSPWKKCGGKKVGSIGLKKDMPQEKTYFTSDVSSLTGLKGKHAIYLVIKSKTKGKSVCEIHDLAFVKKD